MGNWRLCWKNSQTVSGLRKGQNPRLQFTDAEREDSRLKEHIRHADQAADKAEAARARIPKKKKKVKRRTVDPATGKKKTQLRFEEVEKPAPASKLTHAVTAAPGKTLSSQIHKKIGETEEDNVGVQSAHQVEEAAEGGAHLAQSAYRSHRLRPYRAAARAERKLEKPMSMRCIRNLWRRIRLFQQPYFPLAAKAGDQETVCCRQAYRPER